MPQSSTPAVCTSQITSNSPIENYVKSSAMKFVESLLSRIPTLNNVDITLTLISSDFRCELSLRLPQSNSLSTMRTSYNEHLSSNLTSLLRKTPKELSDMTADGNTINLLTGEVEKLGSPTTSSSSSDSSRPSEPDGEKTITPSND